MFSPKIVYQSLPSLQTKKQNMIKKINIAKSILIKKEVQAFSTNELLPSLVSLRQTRSPVGLFNAEKWER
jgi:hypothetical protein